MDRRTYLGVVAGGMAALSGCSSVLESEEYEVGNKEALVPDEVGEDWPDQDLESQPELNEEFDRVWVTPDLGIAVMMDVKIFETIEAAEDDFQSSKATQTSPNDYPLADEAPCVGQRRAISADRHPGHERQTPGWSL